MRGFFRHCERSEATPRSYSVLSPPFPLNYIRSINLRPAYIRAPLPEREAVEGKLETFMVQKPITIRRNLALREFEVKETPNGKQVVFSIKFVKKDGELVFMPMAVAAGLKFNMKENRMRGVVPVDANGTACGHVTPVHIDGLIEWNGMKVRM
jgi:hypothetical protein